MHTAAKFYAVSKKKKEENSVKSNLFNLLIKFIFIIIEGICHMLYPNVFFISSLETFTTLSSYHADHIGQWVINVVLKQRQSKKKLLKSEYKMAVFCEESLYPSYSWSTSQFLPFSTLPEKIITKFTVKSPVF